jgi:hypothetical protein
VAAHEDSHGFTPNYHGCSSSYHNLRFDRGRVCTIPTQMNLPKQSLTPQGGFLLSLK